MESGARRDGEERPLSHAALRRNGPRQARRREIDRIIHALAAKQHGVVARRQLLGPGVRVDEIDGRVRRGELESLYGVYRVGPVRARYEREAAALLACGETAALSHRSAAALHGRLPADRTAAQVEVTIASGRHQGGPDVRVYRAKRLTAEDVTTIEGLTVTTPARTLLDLASVVPTRELEQAFARMLRAEQVSRDEIARVLEGHPRRRGAPALRALLAREDGPALTRSEAEARFLALVRRAQLRAPRTNAQVAGFEVDFLWRAERLIVEVDGRAYHSADDAFERDRRRDAALLAAGFRVMRITWKQISNESEALLVHLTRALTAEAPRRADVRLGAAS